MNDANSDWQKDPALKNMDLKKLAFLSELVSQTSGKSPDSLLPFLVSANKNANAMGKEPMAFFVYEKEGDNECF